MVRGCNLNPFLARFKGKSFWRILNIRHKPQLDGKYIHVPLIRHSRNWEKCRVTLGSSQRETYILMKMYLLKLTISAGNYVKIFNFTASLWKRENSMFPFMDSNRQETSFLPICDDTYGRETSFPRKLNKFLNIQSGVGFEPTKLRLQVFSDTNSWGDTLDHSAIQDLSSIDTPRPNV